MHDAKPVVDLAELEARLQIKAALDSYALGVDIRDMDRFLSAWHEDAVMEENQPPTVLTGHREISEFIEAAWKQFKVLNHFTMNHVVEFDGGKATGLGHAAAMMVRADDVYITAAAEFYDTYERRDGVWRISRRRVEINHVAEHPQAVVSVVARA